LSLPPPLRPLPGTGMPGVSAAEGRLRALGVTPAVWTNGPDDRYAAHEHATTKLLVCAAGSITFLVGAEGHAARLSAGEGFELPAGTRHAAVVGPDGCTCVEGHRR
jgi:quercetin dioxygenase-like cupin family protein